jgi:site-specific DNA-methyltransferase (adenine-specific)
MPESNVFNEDCYETAIRVPDQKIGLLLQDPPFGVTQNEWDVCPDFGKMWPQWLRICKENAAMIFFASQPFASQIILSKPEYFRYDLIWYKPLGTGFLNANKMPLRNHESLLIFYRKLPTYNPQMGYGLRKTGKRRHNRVGTNYGKFSTQNAESKFDDRGTRYPQSVIHVSNGDNTTENQHPTQKPIELIRYLIQTYSNPGDCIFDGYLGSFTTAIAAYLEDRHFIGSELNQEYFEAGNKRFLEQTAQMKLL